MLDFFNSLCEQGYCQPSYYLKGLPPCELWDQTFSITGWAAKNLGYAFSPSSLFCTTNEEDGTQQYDPTKVLIGSAVLAGLAYLSQKRFISVLKRERVNTILNISEDKLTEFVEKFPNWLAFDVDADDETLMATSPVHAAIFQDKVGIAKALVAAFIQGLVKRVDQDKALSHLISFCMRHQKHELAFHIINEVSARGDIQLVENLILNEQYRDDLQLQLIVKGDPSTVNLTENEVKRIVDGARFPQAHSNLLKHAIDKGWHHLVLKLHRLRFPGYETAVRTCIKAGQFTVAEHLIDNRVDIESNQCGFPLHAAIKARHLPMINKLVEAYRLRGAQNHLDKFDIQGQTPLVKALVSGYSEGAVALAKGGANVNAGRIEKIEREGDFILSSVSIYPWEYALQNNLIEVLVAMIENNFDVRNYGHVLIPAIVRNLRSVIVAILRKEDYPALEIETAVSKIFDGQNPFLKIFTEEDDLYNRYKDLLLTKASASAKLVLAIEFVKLKKLDKAKVFLSKLAENEPASDLFRSTCYQHATLLIEQIEDNLDLWTQDTQREQLEEVIDSLILAEHFDEAKALLQQMVKSETVKEALTGFVLEQDETSTKNDPEEAQAPTVLDPLEAFLDKYWENFIQKTTARHRFLHAKANMDLCVDKSGPSPSRMFSLFDSIKQGEIAPQWYREAKSHCAHIVLEDLQKDDNETELDFQDRKRDIAVDFLLEANDVRLAKLLLKDKYAKAKTPLFECFHKKQEEGSAKVLPEADAIPVEPSQRTLKVHK